MLQINQRKNSRIFILVLATVTALSAISDSALLGRKSTSNNIDVATQTEDEASWTDDQDADVFVAEIFPVGVGNFEQIFHPLKRYKKAVLGLDAEIEPFTSQDHKQPHSDEFVVDPIRTQSRTLSNSSVGDIDEEFITVNSLNLPEKRAVYNGPLARENYMAKTKGDLDRITSRDNRYQKANSLASFQKNIQRNDDLIENGKQTHVAYETKIDEGDFIEDGSGSGVKEGSGMHQTENTQQNMLQKDEYKPIRANYELYNSKSTKENSKSYSLKYASQVERGGNKTEEQHFQISDAFTNKTNPTRTENQMSNSSRYEDPLKFSTASAANKSNSVLNDFAGREKYTNGKDWQSINASRLQYQSNVGSSIVGSTETNEQEEADKDINEDDTSDMRLAHKFRNKALFEQVDSTFKQHGGFNEQSINTDERSGEYSKGNTTVNEGSGESIQEDDEEDSVETQNLHSSVLPIHDGNKHPEMARNMNSTMATKVGESGPLKTGYSTKATESNAIFLNREVKYNFTLSHGVETGSVTPRQINAPAVKGRNAKKLTSKFHGDAANDDGGTEYSQGNYGGKQAGYKSLGSKAEDISDIVENTAVSLKSNTKDVTGKGGKNETKLLRSGDIRNFDKHTAHVEEYETNQNEQSLKNGEARKDINKNFAKDTKWDTKYSRTKNGSEYRQNFHAPKSLENAQVEFGLSRGEAARKLFLSTLNKEGSKDDENRKENQRENRKGYLGKNPGAWGTELKDEADMRSHASISSLPSASKNAAIANGYSIEKNNEREETSPFAVNVNEKGGKISKAGQGREDISQKSQDTLNKHKNHVNHNRFSNYHSSRDKKKELIFSKAANANNINFITMMMSQKARELYKNLIHDTSKALMSRKYHPHKGSKHHLMRAKSNLTDESIDLTSKLKSIDEHQMHYVTHRKGSIKGSMTGSTKSSAKPYRASGARLNEMRQLTSSLLHTMTENGHQLMKQTNLHPMRTSDGTHMKGSVPEKLDSPHTLIEKLAELTYADRERTREREFPTPETANTEDVTSRGPELENENPGKTVLQRQSKVGLGTDINMDSLDGRKEGYEFKSLDAEIEGELEKSETLSENNKETAMENLTSNQFDTVIKNATGSAAKVVPSSLSAYNTEEMLERGPERYQFGDDFSNKERLHGNESMSEQKANQTILENATSALHYEGEKVPHKAANDYFGKQQTKENWQTRPNLYFSGNSSLWKHHPFVSMNITPLVDVFYKVNHKNLFDLVKKEEADSKIGKKRQSHSFHVKKINGKRKQHKHKKSQRRKLKKGSRRYKTANHNKRRRRRKHKRRRGKSSLRKGESLNRMMNHKITKKVKDSKKHQKQETKRLHRKYKHKNKKHVKGTAKFGIGEVKQGQNPPEIPKVKGNMPNDVQYYKIENSGKYGAVCIDGSAPGYFFRKGKGPSINKWIIHLHGGAWCYDAETCFRRSFSILGSSNNWSAENITNFFQGVLSENEEINPIFSDWNVVVQSYCDGGLFSGRRKRPLVHRGRKLYFRGRQILKAMIESLKSRNLQKASDIILSGTSAGGLAVLLQGDYLRHKLPKTALVRGLVDAGFFIKAQAEDGSNIIANQFRGLYELHNPKLRKACEREKDNSTRFLCLFPENTLQQTKLPIYFINALYDHWQLSELQQVHCVYNNDQCRTTERDRILNFRKTMFSRLNDAVAQLPNSGLFADSCIGHGQAIVDYTWSRIHVNNSTLRDAFKDWLWDVHGDKKHLKVDCHFPCNGSCPRAMVNSCIKNFQGASINHRTRRNVELC